MNKWQIIYPSVAIIVVVLVIGLVRGSREHDYFVRMVTYSVGTELIAKTNSEHLVGIGHDLHTQLSELLGSPTHIAAVLLGDAPGQLGTKAQNRLLLTNEAGNGVEIRLRGGDIPGTFHVLSYSKPAEHRQ